MPTTVHIPANILKRVDAEARKRNLSRNRYVIEALERQVAADQKRDAWPEGFFDSLRQPGPPGTKQAVVDMQKWIKRNRRSKKLLDL